jgi:hypothetical protein
LARLVHAIGTDALLAERVLRAEAVVGTAAERVVDAVSIVLNEFELGVELGDR